MKVYRRVATNFTDSWHTTPWLDWYLTQAMVSRVSDHPHAAVIHLHVPIVLFGHPGWSVLDHYRNGSNYVWNVRLGMVPDPAWKI